MVAISNKPSIIIIIIIITTQTASNMESKRTFSPFLLPASPPTVSTHLSNLPHLNAEPHKAGHLDDKVGLIVQDVE